MVMASSAVPGENPRPAYARRPPLVLVHGLAGQAESWYCNLDAWRPHFDVYQPNLLVYEGATLHRRIEEGKPIDIDYLVGRLSDYLDGFVQAPPYHLVANSLGGKVAVEFAVRRPELVDRMILLCPAGLGDQERLPVVEGVRGKDLRSVVESVFHDPRQADPGILRYYQKQVASRRWRMGVLRTVRGTTGHCVRDQLPRVTRPTLLIVGQEDRIIDPHQVIEAARLLPQGRLRVLPGCGHAPQVEQPEVVNRLVIDFLLQEESGRV